MPRRMRLVRCSEDAIKVMGLYNTRRVCTGSAECIAGRMCERGVGFLTMCRDVSDDGTEIQTRIAVRTKRSRIAMKPTCKALRLRRWGYRRLRSRRAGLETIKRGTSAHSAGRAGQMTIDRSDCMKTVRRYVMGAADMDTNGHAPRFVKPMPVFASAEVQPIAVA